MKNFLLLAFIFLYTSLLSQNHYPKSNVLIDRVNEYKIDSTIRENKAYALSYHIKEISTYRFVGTNDSTLAFSESYDDEGRIQHRKQRLGKENYYIDYKYDEKGRLSGFTKQISYQDDPEITKLYYNENDRVNRLERLFPDGHSAYSEMYYYPDGKLKQCNNTDYYYNEDGNLTHVVYSGNRNDTTTRILYDKNGCEYSYYWKYIEQDSITSDANCRTIEWYYKRLGYKDKYEKTFKDFDEKILFTYEGDNLVSRTSYSYKKKFLSKKKELKDTWTIRYEYYDNGLLKSENGVPFYYKFHNKK